MVITVYEPGDPGGYGHDWEGRADGAPHPR